MSVVSLSVLQTRQLPTIASCKPMSKKHTPCPRATQIPTIGKALEDQGNPGQYPPGRFHPCLTKVDVLGTFLDGDGGVAAVEQLGCQYCGPKCWEAHNYALVCFVTVERFIPNYRAVEFTSTIKKATPLTLGSFYSRSITSTQGDGFLKYLPAGLWG